jgi:hypothetical protein
MRTISSVEFRKVYARLTERVVVTVNGHPLGVWRPASVDETGRPSEGALEIGPHVEFDDFVEGLRKDEERHGRLFSSKPFTPVPKPGKK